MKDEREIRRIVREGVREGGEGEKEKRSEGGEIDKEVSEGRSEICEGEKEDKVREWL